MGGKIPVFAWKVNGVKRIELLNISSVTGCHRGAAQSYRLPWSVGKHSNHLRPWSLFSPPSLVAPQSRSIPGSGAGAEREWEEDPSICI